MKAPPSGKSSRSTEVITAYFRSRIFTVLANLFGSSRSRPVGRPVVTAQYVHALVQMSPNIMKVAVSFSQHSPILGHLASSQTV